jgi:hypothetical protein
VERQTVIPIVAECIKAAAREMIAQVPEGCSLLEAMSPREWHLGESKRYREILAIDKKLTWRMVGAHSPSLFDACLDGPPYEYFTPSHLQFIDWQVSQSWRKALIEASGMTHRGRIVRRADAPQ